MDVSENSGTPKSAILIRFSIIFTIHFGVFPYFLETPKWFSTEKPSQLDISVRRSGVYATFVGWKGRIFRDTGGSFGSNRIRNDWILQGFTSSFTAFQIYIVLWDEMDICLIVLLLH